MTSVSTTNNISHFGLIVAFVVFLSQDILFKLIYEISARPFDERLITAKRKHVFLIECMNTIMTSASFTAMQHLGVSVAVLLLLLLLYAGLLFWPGIIDQVLLYPHASYIKPEIFIMNIEELMLFGMIMTIFGSLLYYGSAKHNTRSREDHLQTLQHRILTIESLENTFAYI